MGACGAREIERERESRCEGRHGTCLFFGLVFTLDVIKETIGIANCNLSFILGCNVGCNSVDLLVLN